MNHVHSIETIIEPVAVTDVKVGDVLESYGFHYEVTKVKVYSRHTHVYVKVSDSRETLCPPIPNGVSLRRVVNPIQ